MEESGSGFKPPQPTTNTKPPESTARDKGDEPPRLPPPPAKTIPPPQSNNEREHCRPDQTPWWKMILETAAIFIGIYVAIIYSGQLEQMKSSVSQTERQVILGQGQLAIANRSTTLAENTFAATVNQFRLDQRAWIGPTEFLPAEFIEAGQRVYLKEGEEASFALSISNFGKTPAKRVVQRFTYHSFPIAQRFVPIYPGTPQKLGVFQPNLKLTAVTPKTERLLKSQIDSFRSEVFRLYVFGMADYYDVWGQQHHTRFCFYLVKDLTGFTDCDTYNEAD